MATFYNAKVEKFFSRFWNPGRAGVDFFVQNLESENSVSGGSASSAYRESAPLAEISKGSGNTGDPVLAIV